jgi:integrase
VCNSFIINGLSLAGLVIPSPSFFLFLFIKSFIYVMITFMATSQPGILSAPSPLQHARKSTLYFLAIGNALPAVSSLVKCNDNSEHCLFPGVRVAIQLIILNHMRVGELTQVKKCDEIRPSMFFIKGIKRSHSYSIHIPIDSRNRAILDSMPFSQLLFPFTYQYIYRSMLSAGMSYRVRSRVNRVVTHIGRFDLADKLHLMNLRSSVSSLLRHKSKSSASYYLPAEGE